MFRVCALFGAFLTLVLPPASALRAQQAGPFTPHDGMRITRAYTSDYGPDAEEFNIISSVSPKSFIINYSDTRGIVARRKVRTRDRERSRGYMLGFGEGLPELIKGSTTLGISSAVLEELRNEGGAVLALFYDTTLRPMKGELRLEEDGFTVPVLIEDEVVDVPAVRASGFFKRGIHHARGEFVFLDNRRQPLLIEYRIHFSFEQRPRTVRLTRITAGRSQLAAMEHTLRTLKRLKLYGIHFDFDRASLRREARALVADIALMLEQNPDWTLRIEGHTDAIGSPGYNLELSQRRAQAIADTLIQRHGIDPYRLAADGLGQTQPIATNDTLHGRALNRRVELVRTDR